MKNCFLAGVLLLVTLVAQSQEKDSSRFDGIKINVPKTEMELQFNNQFWNVMTLNNETAEQDGFRNDLFIRRGRIGLQGTTFDKFDFSISLAYDGIGKSESMKVLGLSNSADAALSLLDAYVTYKLLQPLNITFGYFRPQIGRESITSSFYCLGFDKALTNSDLREHMVGRNTGREAGLNLGGLIGENLISLNYNLGVFNTTSSDIIGTDENVKNDALYTGRLALSIGAPELDSYKIKYTQTYYGTRKGVTLAYNQSYQGKTGMFQSNQVSGADLLLNYGGLDLAAEYDWLKRDTMNGAEKVKTRDEVYSIKAAYYIIVWKNKLLQPGYAFTESVNGKSTIFHDAGVNLLMYEDKLKLGLHYIWGKEGGDEYQFITAGLQMMF
jgi:hypothetical protein